MDPLRHLTADRGDRGRRLDLVLRRHLTDLRDASRTRVQSWIVNGHVTVNRAAIRKPSTRVSLGDLVAVDLTAASGDGPAPPRSRPRIPRADAPLDVLYEDECLLVLNKPAGLVVHPGYGNPDGTLMNALLSRARTWPRPQRPSIVNRLDRLTTGVVVVARTAAVHAALQRAWAADAEKDYLAVVYGRVKVKAGAIRLALHRDAHDRRRVVTSRTAGAQSLTRFERLGTIAAPHAGLSLVRCRLVTGRMHQIRVHLAARGWPIVGDPVYGEPRWSNVRDPQLAGMLGGFPRQALHAWRVALTHPATGVRLRVEAPLPPDLAELIAVAGLSPHIRTA